MDWRALHLNKIHKKSEQSLEGSSEVDADFGDTSA